MTLLKPGKLQELAKEIAKTQIEILALQEVRWPGKGQIKNTIYSTTVGLRRKQAKQAQVSYSWQKYIINFELHNKHLCKLRVKGKYNNITLINAYAPTEDKTEEIKEQFYDDLQYMVDKVPESDLMIILGDVNAKLGKEPAYQKIIGKHTLHEETNRNGELLCDIAAANNMIVMSTQLQHKQIHKGTWRSPDNSSINQIDHVLVNQNKKQ